jgi:hypothetical protein
VKCSGRIRHAALLLQKVANRDINSGKVVLHVRTIWIEGDNLFSNGPARSQLLQGAGKSLRDLRASKREAANLALSLLR